MLLQKASQACSIPFHTLQRELKNIFKTTPVITEPGTITQEMLIKKSQGNISDLEKQIFYVIINQKICLSDETKKNILITALPNSLSTIIQKFMGL